MPPKDQPSEKTDRHCTLEVDGDFLSDLNSCLLLETAIHMSVGKVESIMAGLGFADATIRGLSQNSFIAHFPNTVKLDELDLDFMSIGFTAINKVKWDNTIPSRRVDVEFRGLPLIAWTSQNCKLLVDKWGDILNYYPIIDCEGFYQVPRIRLETKCTSCINESVSISVEGKTWNIKIVELVSDNQDFLEEPEEAKVVDLTTPTQPKENVKVGEPKEGVKTQTEDPDTTQSIAKNSDQAVTGPEEVASPDDLQDKDYENQNEQEPEELEDSSGSLINPVTPPTLLCEEDIEGADLEGHPNVIEEDEGVKDWNLKWQIRDISSDEATATHSIQSQKSSILNEDLVEEVDNCALLTSINNMRIKSRRGRPSKGKAKAKEIRAFKVPRRRKIKGMKLGLPVIVANQGTFDEAKFVYESALNMGLIPDHTEEKSLQLIRDNLDSKAMILCLQETKRAQWNEKMIGSLGITGEAQWIDSPSQGLSGGLLLAWDRSIIVTSDMGCHQNWQWIIGSQIGCAGEFLCVNIYAPQKSVHKQKLWLEISSFLLSKSNLPLVVLGDFNVVLSDLERENCIYNDRDTTALLAFMNDNGLSDVPLNNGLFTWFGPENRKSRLDRALINSKWNNTGNWSLQGLNRKSSDHRPIFLSSNKSDWGPRPFRLFNCWLQNAEFLRSLGEVWKANSTSSLNTRFRELRRYARMWNQNSNGNVDAKIAKLEKDQEEADDKNEAQSIKKKIKAELELAYEHKSSMLCQLSRMNWQLHGERNSRIFHRAIAGRNRVKLIHALEMNSGWTTEPNIIKRVFFNHFQDFFCRPPADRIFSLHQGLLPSLSNEGSKLLVEDFTELEIWQALQASDSNKAPGPDGVNPGVLKALWPTIKGDICSTFNIFHSSGFIPPGSNSSFIALIPKKSAASKPSDFRPISLMNSSMKLISKVLARRLSPFMNTLISHTQTAFVKGRQISDGILLTSEIYHSLKSARSRGLILKIDFAKAFDSINWGFLFEVMELMQFDSKWIHWIRKLFDSSRVSILVNGSPTDEFHPTRGLRQGDPLSPLLFNLIGEALSCLLKSAHNSGLFNGVSVAGYPEKISHLQFADDIILFVANDSHSVRGIKATLKIFEVISGLKINYGKSKLYGFKESPEQLKQWADWLGCSIGNDQFTYLGATIGQSPKKSIFWKPLEQKLVSKLQKWDSANVSMAGRLVLLQSVLDSLPSYWFSLFKMPQKTIKFIDKKRRHFLWGGKSDTARKMHLLNWERLCIPKHSGGLGIAPLEARNISLLAKWWWRCYSQRDHLWNKILSRKYGEKIRFNLGSLAGSQGISPIMQGISSIRNNRAVEPLLKDNSFKWKLGNGESIFFWEDWWRGDRPLSSLYPRIYTLSSLKFKSVAEFLVLWTENGLNSIIWQDGIIPTDMAEISSLNDLIDDLQVTHQQDTLVWLGDKCSFSSKVILKRIVPASTSSNPRQRIWSLIWSLKVPPKIRIFLWKIQWGVLPTKSLLHSRMPDLNPMCVKCGNRVETLNHLLWECEVAKWVWKFIAIWWNLESKFRRLNSFSLEIIMSFQRSAVSSRVWHTVVAAAVWSIWLARNELVFQSTSPSRSCLLNLIFTRISKWGEASKLIPFSADPLWKSNPNGAVAIYFNKLNTEYWNYKMMSHDLVCAVDGAWGECVDGSFKGAIGGRVVNKNKKILHVFSIPVQVENGLHAELEALIYAIGLVSSHYPKVARYAICSDSKEALQLIRNREEVGNILQRSIPDFIPLLDSSVSLYYVSRELNVEADALAKKGIQRIAPALFWDIGQQSYEMIDSQESKSP
nr:PREDICTED: uncharacterized protein LOC108226007 [Daucus carota subsp. sativus]